MNPVIDNTKRPSEESWTESAYPSHWKNVVVKIEILDTATIEKALNRSYLSTPLEDLKPNINDIDTYVVLNNVKIEETCNNIQDTNLTENSANTTKQNQKSSDNVIPGYQNCLIFQSSTSNYSCGNCTFSTETVKDAIFHFIYNNSESTTPVPLKYNTKECLIECNTCKFDTICDQIAVKHWQEHFCNISFKCFICSYSTNEDSLLKVHLLCHLNEMNLIKRETIKNEIKPFVCIKCDYTVKTSIKNLIQHYLKVHGNKRFVCGQCKQSFYYYNAIKKHLSIHLSKNDIHLRHIHSPGGCVSKDLLKQIKNKGKIYYQCAYCSFATISKTNLKAHSNVIHSDKIKHFFCDLCNESCKSMSSLKTHMQYVHENNILEARTTTTPSKNKRKINVQAISKLYKKCFIFNTFDQNYKCAVCSFSTLSVNDAVLHFLNNKSEDATNFVKYNVNRYVFECNTCEFSTPCDREALNHWRNHLAKLSLYCFICSYFTSEDSLLKLHLLCHLNEAEKVKNGFKSLVCFKCNIKVNGTNNKLLKCHYLRSHGLKRFMCGQCKQRFYYVNTLKTHLTIHLSKNHIFHVHSSECESKVNNINTNKPLSPTKIVTNSYKCNYCSFVTVFKKNLEVHIKEAHNDIVKYYLCKICDSKFKFKNALKKHVHRMHVENIFLKCEECDFKTRYQKSLIRHMKYHKEFSQLCYICGFQTGDEVNMNKHIYRHNAIKAFFCDMCSYKGTFRAALNKHISLVHSVEKPYSCNLCEYRCKTKRYLEVHQYTHKEINSNVKQYECNLCNYTSKFKKTLEEHLMVHSTNRQQFYCKVCNKQYLRKSSLRVHEHTHLNFKPLKCTECDSEFMTKSGLENHMKLHTGEGRMYCLECNYSSVRKGNFIAHVNKTCLKAKHANVDLRRCFHCNFTSNHRSNFKTHVNNCYRKV